MRKLFMFLAVLSGCHERPAGSFEGEPVNGVFWNSSNEAEAQDAAPNPWATGVGSIGGGSGGNLLPEVPESVKIEPETGATEPQKAPSHIRLRGYEETSGAHKYLTIEEASGAAVSAESCALLVYNNGAVEAGRTIPLPGLATGEVRTLCTTGAPHPGCDQVLGSAPFNGDDALVIQCGEVVRDALGRVGEDPGTEWREGAISTKDMALVRCHFVAREPSEPFHVGLDWMVTEPTSTRVEALAGCADGAGGAAP